MPTVVSVFGATVTLGAYGKLSAAIGQGRVLIAEFIAELILPFMRANNFKSILTSVPQNAAQQKKLNFTCFSNRNGTGPVSSKIRA